MTIRDLKQGDTVLIGEETYRLMIWGHSAWGCRKLLEDEEWSISYTWHTFDVAIEKVVKIANQGGDQSSGGDSDPMKGR